MITGSFDEVSSNDNQIQKEKCLCINFAPKLNEWFETRAIYHSKVEETTIEFREWVDMETYKEWLEQEKYKVILFDIYDFQHLEDFYRFYCITVDSNVKSLYCLKTFFELLDDNVSPISVINFLTNGGI